MSEVASTPQSAVDFMLDQRDISRATLTRSWDKTRVSEFFIRKHRLSVSQLPRACAIATGHSTPSAPYALQCTTPQLPPSSEF